MAVGQAFSGRLGRLMESGATASNAVLFTAGKDRPVITQIIVCNRTSPAAATTYNLSFLIDGTRYYIANLRPIAANETHILDVSIPMSEGSTFEIARGASASVDFAMMYFSTGGVASGR